MNFDPKTRAWIYAICCAVFGVLTTYGLINSEQMAAWTALAMAVCGLALNNVSYDE